MVRFLCFHTPIHYYKSKKSASRSAKTMHRTSQDAFHDLPLNVSVSASSSNPLDLKVHDNNASNNSEQITSAPSLDCGWKSGEMSNSFSPLDNVEVLQTVRIKKSQSVGSGLDRAGSISCGLDIGEAVSGSYEENFNRMFDAFDQNGLEESFDYKDPGMKLQETLVVESVCINADLGSNKPIFSIGDPEQLGEVREYSDTQLSTDHVVDSGHHTPCAAPKIVKSFSLPTLRFSKACLAEGLPAQVFRRTRSRSAEELSVLVTRREYFSNEDGLHSRISVYKSKSVSSFQNLSQASHLLEKGMHYRGVSREDCDLSNHSGGSYEVADQGRDNIFESEKDICGNQYSDGYDSGKLTSSVKNWVLPETTEVDDGYTLRQETSALKQDQLSSEEFNARRVVEWVSKIKLENSCTLQELGECSSSTLNMRKDPNVAIGVTAAKSDPRTTPGMEVANRYIASLTPMSSSAQMANLGLVVIPFLSAFISLRVLNLSGNSIVRITAGALPRGLHVLNLSKNNISTIEGLRELSRLRVLDLSYNRIFRIGHGLAYCSSLKELYLAGNKISEVEGLHRLLKLNVLDLRFNKISTTKCLGQLAANYGSLQAINLEGNPAQKNVGDEHLKKYLLGLLPRLVCFNRHTIRSGSSKEVIDRPAQSITAYQFDRGVRSDHKILRRGSHAKGIHKLASSSSHNRQTQATESPKRSKGRHVPLPPNRAKGTHHHSNVRSKLVPLQTSDNMRRSRSEGTLDGASEDFVLMARDNK